MRRVEEADAPTNTFVIPPSPCPFCGHVTNAATGFRDEVDNTPPTAEDSVTVCIECASILFYAEDLTLRAPSTEELAALKQQENGIYEMLLRAQRVVRALDRRNPEIAKNTATTTGSQAKLRRQQAGVKNRG